MQRRTTFPNLSFHWSKICSAYICERTKSRGKSYEFKNTHQGAEEHGGCPQPNLASSSCSQTASDDSKLVPHQHPTDLIHF